MKNLFNPSRLVRPGQMDPNADGTLVPVGLPAQEMKPSQPRAAAASRRIVLPGCDFPPAGAIPVDEMGDANLVGLGAGATGTLVTVIIPATYTFRIDGIGFGADDESSLRYLTWSIVATPPVIAIPGYVNKSAGVGSILHLSWIFALRGSSETITVVATNGSGDPVTSLHFVCRLQGWFYTEEEIA